MDDKKKKAYISVLNVDVKPKDNQTQNTYSQDVSNGSDIDKKVLGQTETQNGIITICEVNGKKVRDKYNPDFIGGGHHEAYNFIPQNEFWIEQMKDFMDEVCILQHEFMEKPKMDNGMDYETAHADSNNKEGKIRDMLHGGNGDHNMKM